MNRNKYIKNLDPLSNLKYIGSICFQETGLEQIDGLASVTHIDNTVLVFNNDNLKSISLKNLAYTNNFIILENPQVNSLELSSQLKITGDLVIRANSQLQSLIGLENIINQTDSLKTLTIIENSKL